MNTNDYLKDFKSAVEPLVLAGTVRVVDEKSDPAYFGDSLLVLEGSRIRIRLVADRGQFFADVSSVAAPPRWLPLQSVLPHVIAGTSPSWGPWKTIPELGRLLQAHFYAIEVFLNSGDPALSRIREVT
jgi:hypothetical protein